MLFIKILFNAILLISLVKSLPIDEKKNSDANKPSTRRASLETYNYNHPPSIGIPVSVLYNEHGSESDESSKSAKKNTERSNKESVSTTRDPFSKAIPVSVVIEGDKSESDLSDIFVKKNPDIKPVRSQDFHSVAIPVSVVIEQNVSGSDKSGNLEKINSIRPDKQSVPSDKPSPVSVVFDKESQSSERVGKSEKQISEINGKPPTTSNEQSAESIPVAVVFQDKGNHGDSKMLPEEIKKDKEVTAPTIMISTESISSNTGIKIPIRNSTLKSEPEQKDEKSKIFLKPQPRQFQLEYQVPVAVVYDEPVEITNKKLKTYREQLRMRNTRRRRPNPTTEPTIEITTVEDDVQEHPLKNEVKQNVRAKQRVNQTQDKSGANETLPVAIIVTENKNEESQAKLTQEKPNISRSKVNQNVRGKQRFKQIQDIPSANIPVVVQLTENQAKEPQKSYAQDKPITGKVKQNFSGRQRVKQTQDMFGLNIPVVVQITENNIEKSEIKHAQNKTGTTKSEAKQNSRGMQREKQIQDMPSVEENIPVVVQFTENKKQDTSTQRTQDKPSPSKSEIKQDTPSAIENIPVVIHFTENKDTQTSHTQEKPSTTDSHPKEIISKREQSNNTLKTQNRDSSFKAQQKEEKRQDSESAKKRERDPVVPILKSDSHAYGNSGSFSYSYESGDGTKAFETGELKNLEDDKTGAAVVGGFSYKDKDGTDISLSYTADENGYRPVGDHLPTPPPIPVAIQRALDYLATKTTPASVTEAGEA